MVQQVFNRTEVDNIVNKYKARIEGFKKVIAIELVILVLVGVIAIGLLLSNL